MGQCGRLCFNSLVQTVFSKKEKLINDLMNTAWSKVTDLKTRQNKRGHGDVSSQLCSSLVVSCGHQSCFSSDDATGQLTGLWLLIGTPLLTVDSLLLWSFTALIRPEEFRHSKQLRHVFNLSWTLIQNSGS